MAGLSGYLWLIIGAAVAIFAKYVENRTNAAGMTLFFYVGLVFVGVGVFKIVSKVILKDFKKEKDLGPAIDKSIQHLKQQKYLNQEKPSKQIIVSCAKCGTRHYNTSNFCHRCGTPLNHAINR